MHKFLLDILFGSLFIVEGGLIATIQYHDASLWWYVLCIALGIAGYMIAEQRYRKYPA